MSKNQPLNCVENENLDHDGMMQVNEILERTYCENPSYIKVLVRALVNAEGKTTINGKWEVKTVYLTGSEVKKFYQDEKVIRYILSKIIGKPFRLAFKDRHNLQLIVLK